MRRARYSALFRFMLIIAFAGCLAAPHDASAQDKQKSRPLPAPRIGFSDPKPRTAGAIRLASFNVENLFDDKDDPALSGDYEDIDDTKPEAHKKSVADAIRRVDADILALQEIESFDVLIEFRDAYLAGMGYDHVVSFDAGDERGIENSVLSRFPLHDPKIWLGMSLEGEHTEKDGRRDNPWFKKPLTFHRTPLRVTAEVPAEKTGGEPYRLTLFVVHHKSGRNFNYWREAEAKGVLKLVEEFQKDNPDANIAVLGDFNAETQEDSVQSYLAAGFSDLFIDRRLDDARCYTHASDRAIDLILYNKNLQPEIIRGSRFVLGTQQLRPEEDWRTAPKPEGYSSDHAPVVVDIKPRDNGAPR